MTLTPTATPRCSSGRVALANEPVQRPYRSQIVITGYLVLACSLPAGNLALARVTSAASFNAGDELDKEGIAQVRLAHISHRLVVLEELLAAARVKVRRSLDEVSELRPSCPVRLVLVPPTAPSVAHTESLLTGPACWDADKLFSLLLME